MFRNAQGSSFLSILYSMVNRPLLLWDKKIRNGHVKRLVDPDFQNLVLEIAGTKLASNYITCPADLKKTLGIRFPVLNLTVKNMNKFFAFDVQILDDKEVRRRFRVSTSTANAEVKPFTCKLPLILEEGWNQITFPLNEYTKQIYGTTYVETLRVQIYSNCRIRRVYFSDRLYTEEELPTEFKMVHFGQPTSKLRSNFLELQR